MLCDSKQRARSCSGSQLAQEHAVKKGWRRHYSEYVRAMLNVLSKLELHSQVAHNSESTALASLWQAWHKTCKSAATI